MRLSASYTILCHLSLLLGIHSMPSYTEKQRIYRSTKTNKHYRPVIVIHGLFEEENSLINMTNYIKEKHPGSDVHYLDILLGYLSITVPLWQQVEIFYKAMTPIMENAKYGVNLLAFSQGGLIARGILETKPHNVRNFISLSSPLAGQFGDAYLYLADMDLTKENAYKTFYEPYYQGYSVPNYWNDPHHQDLYLEKCKYLPYIDNVKSGMKKLEYKQNFAQIKNLVLIGGPDDGIVSPWQSSYFSFYDDNEQVVDFRQRRIYTEDLFGLQTLDKANKIKIYIVPKVHHFKWHENKHVLELCVLPWLD